MLIIEYDIALFLYLFKIILLVGYDDMFDYLIDILFIQQNSFKAFLRFQAYVSKYKSLVQDTQG